MRWNDFPIVRLVVPFIIGIPLWYFLGNYIVYLEFFILCLWIIQFATSYIPTFYPNYRWRYFSTGIIYLLFLLMGSATAKYNFPYSSQNYFGNHISSYSNAIVTVVEPTEITKKSYKLLVKINQLIGKNERKNVNGKALIYIKKDSLLNTPNYGDIIIVDNKFLKIQQPTNPYEFDYASFLDKKGIRYSAFLRDNEYKILGRDTRISAKRTAFTIRNILLGQLEKNGLKGDEYAVAASLLLGYREALSDELQESYRSAGVMHILCVSGMHVGILFLILSQIFSFLSKVKNGSSIRLIIILLNIWAFAVITGLSPSVTRAAVMFTFVSIGKNIGRNINVYNTLAASALITLILDPYSIFDVGFQLSYAAVIAIAALHKPIYSLWIPRYKIPDYLWQIVVMSLAAQIGTAPISIYYFHQFPNYFLLSNLVVILLIAPIFYLALFTIIMSFIPWLSSWLGYFTSLSIKLLNFLVNFFQELPFSTTQNISYQPLMLLFLILFVLFMTLMLINKYKNLIYVNLFIIIALLSISINKIHESGKINRSINFNTPGHFALLFHRNNQAVLITDSASFANPQLISYQTSGYLSHYNLKPKFINIDEQGKYNGLIYRNNNFLIINQKLYSIYSQSQKWQSTIDVDFLFDRDKQIYNIEKILNNYNPKNLILTSELWENQRQKLKSVIMDSSFTIYDVAEEGAWKMNY